jgi:hypothetical protein
MPTSPEMNPPNRPSPKIVNHSIEIDPVIVLVD